MEKCFFKKICDTESKEGLAYLHKFNIDPKRCKYSCSGFLGYGTCEAYLTSKEAQIEGGLGKLLKDEQKI